MKVILTGATGFIGSAVLEVLLRHPSITTILVLSRRPLKPQIKSPKLVVLIVKDFANYDAPTISHLQGAQACIWCLGSPTGGRDVHYGFTSAGINTIQESLSLAKEPEADRKMTFVYVSGGLVEPNQDKTLLFLSKTRKMRGEVETLVTDLGKQNPKHWRTFIARPGLVTKTESLVRFVSSFYIPVALLGAALADIAVNGSEKQRLENADLKEIGKAVGAAKAVE